MKKDLERIMILELIEERNNLYSEINFLKDEMCNQNKKYIWCKVDIKEVLINETK